MKEFSPSPAPDSEQDALVDEAVVLLRGQRPLENDGEATRRRLHASRALMPARRRRRRAQFVVGLAATFVLSTAFAWYTMTAPEPLPAPSDPLPAPTTTTDSVAPLAAQMPPASPPASTEEHQRSPADASTAPISSSTRELRKAPRRHDLSHSAHVLSEPSAAAAPPVATSAQAGAPTPVTPERQRALYMTAHRLHFRGAPEAALSAWDAYLATSPSGSLAVEARYNRAVVLARLGERDAARAELAPFANGTYGNFRRTDASVLLKQLE